MAAYSTTYNGSTITSSAEFQAMVQAIEAALLASGTLVVAGDTGQIDPTTVTVPNANAFAGSRIYKFANAAKGQYYMKVEYGLTASSYRNLRVSWATSTNGAGILAGFTSGLVTANGTAQGTPTDFLAGGGGAYGGIAVGRISTTAGFVLGMSRLVADDGTVSATGAIGIASSSGSNVNFYRTDYSSVAQSQTSEAFPNAVSTSNTPGTATKVGVLRGALTLNGEVLEPPALTFRSTEFGLVGASSAFAATWRGAAHTFLPVTLFNATGNYVNSSGSGMAILFE